MTIKDKVKIDTRVDIVYICPGCHMSRACVLEEGKVLPMLKVLSRGEATACVLSGAKVLKLGCRDCESRWAGPPSDAVVV